MARYEISNEVRSLDRLITGFASSCGYEIQTVFNDLLRFIIHGFSPGAPPISNWKYKRQAKEHQQLLKKQQIPFYLLPLINKPIAEKITIITNQVVIDIPAILVLLKKSKQTLKVLIIDSIVRRSPLSQEFYILHIQQ